MQNEGQDSATRRCCRRGRRQTCPRIYSIRTGPIFPQRSSFDVQTEVVDAARRRWSSYAEDWYGPGSLKTFRARLEQAQCPGVGEFRRRRNKWRPMIWTERSRELQGGCLCGRGDGCTQRGQVRCVGASGATTLAVNPAREPWRGHVRCSLHQNMARFTSFWGEGCCSGTTCFSASCFPPTDCHCFAARPAWPPWPPCPPYPPCVQQLIQAKDCRAARRRLEYLETLD